MNESWTWTVEELLKGYRDNNGVILLKGKKHVANFYDMDELKAVYGDRLVAEFSINNCLVLYLKDGD